jgi:hypothetical protein
MVDREANPTAARSESGAYVREFHPSISRTAVGAWLGRLYESLPRITSGVRWSHLLFCLPTAPMAAGLWLWLKASGERYVLTTSTVERRRNIGDLALEQADLSAISDVRVEIGPGDVFFGAGTLVMLGAGDVPVARWPGVAEPRAVRQTILDAIHGVRHMASMRQTVAARQVLAPQIPAPQIPAPSAATP